jgi:prepilin peptidase CpaA
MPTVIETTLIALVIIGAWSDLRTRKIPNSITASGAVVGLVLHGFYGGFYGAIQSVAGAAFGLAIFLALYAAGGMGAGDVKLFAAVGAFTGPRALVLIFAFTGLLGGIAALAFSLYRGRLRQTLTRTGELLIDMGRLRLHEMRASAGAPESLRLPYGAVIAGGTLISLIVLR